MRSMAFSISVFISRPGCKTETSQTVYFGPQIVRCEIGAMTSEVMVDRLDGVHEPSYLLSVKVVHILFM